MWITSFDKYSFIFGAAWILSFLPFAGGEFGTLGGILLVVSLYLTAKQIQNPAVCKIIN